MNHSYWTNAKGMSYYNQLKWNFLFSLAYNSNYFFFIFIIVEIISSMFPVLKTTMDWGRDGKIKQK